LLHTQIDDEAVTHSFVSRHKSQILLNSLRQH